MKNTSFVPAAGGLCAYGGVLGAIGGLVTGFYPPAVTDDRFSYPYTPTGFLVAESAFVLNHVLLLVGLLGLAASGAMGGSRYGRVGLRIGLAGMALLALCEIRAMTLLHSATATDASDVLGAFYGVASILIGIGLVMAGVAVVRAGRWADWRRYTPLTCGAAVFVIVIPGLAGGFLAGRLVLTVWMLLFTALGVALRDPDPVPLHTESLRS